MILETTAAYLASHLIIMEVHERPGVLFDLSGVNKHFGKAEAVADVRRAASPLPSLVPAIETLLLFVTAAVAQVTLRTGGGDGVGHPGCDNGVREGRFFAPCKSAEENTSE